MIVTSAAYNEFGLIVAVINGVTMTVPNDPNNYERQAISEWEAAGNTIGEYVSPPLPPIEIPADMLFFDRMTDDEYDSLEDSIRTNESARVYRGWVNASQFVEGTDMWSLLDKHLSLILQEARKAELLARPV